MSDNLDYYQILGVERNATQEEIKKAYRYKASIHHQDHAPTQFKDRADEDMKKINAAYDILGDPEKRAKYDKELEHDLGFNHEGQLTDLMLFSFLTNQRRNELKNDLRSDIFKGRKIVYTSKGYIVDGYNSYNADNARQGNAYTPSEIAMGLQVPQGDIEAALNRLMNTVYIYKNDEKYGATRKYFADHPEIYYIRDYGINIQKEKDQLDELERQKEAKRQVEKDAEEKRIKKQYRMWYLRDLVALTMIVPLISTLLVASNLEINKMFILNNIPSFLKNNPLFVCFIAIYVLYCAASLTKSYYKKGLFK